MLQKFSNVSCSEPRNSDCASCLLAFAQPFILLKFAEQAILSLFIFWLGTVSCVSIASISIDRFLMVTYPIKHRIWMKGRFMSLWVGAIWIVSCLPSVISLLSDHNKSSLNGIFVLGVIVVIISAVMYFSTYCQLRKQSNNISLQNSSETIEHRMRIMKEKKFLKTIIIIACIAFFCLVPSLIFFIFMPTNLQGDDLDSKTWNTIFQSMLYANFAVNPLIYILRLPNYRKSFYKLYCRRGSWLVGWIFKFQVLLEMITNSMLEIRDLTPTFLGIFCFHWMKRRESDSIFSQCNLTSW